MLELKNISKSFAKDLDPVLNNISLDIPEGQFCILVGSNGSGKSTLLNIILGDISSSGGSAKLNNKNIAHLSLQQRASWMSSVHQNTTLGTIPEMTLLENMALSLIKGDTARFSLYTRHKEFVLTAIKELGLGLEAYLNTPLGSLSGGQRQTIATLMGVLRQPKILLLDEHTSALDPKTQRKLMDYSINYIEKHHMTALMVTHNLEDAVRHGDRLIMLHKGRIVQDLGGEQKKTLTTQKLLALFHDYEDEELLKHENIFGDSTQ